MRNIGSWHISRKMRWSVGVNANHGFLWTVEYRRSPDRVQKVMKVMRDEHEKLLSMSYKLYQFATNTKRRCMHYELVHDRAVKVGSEYRYIIRH